MEGIVQMMSLQPTHLCLCQILAQYSFTLLNPSQSVSPACVIPTQ